MPAQEANSIKWKEKRWNRCYKNGVTTEAWRIFRSCVQSQKTTVYIYYCFYNMINASVLIYLLVCLTDLRLELFSFGKHEHLYLAIHLIPVSYGVSLACSCSLRIHRSQSRSGSEIQSCLSLHESRMMCMLVRIIINRKVNDPEFAGSR